MKTAIPITHARRNKLQQWDRTTGKCPSERFCLSVFHKASAWQLRKGEYNCSKCISFLAIKQVSHVHLGDGKRKGSAGRREKLWRIESCYFILNFIFHLCIFMSTSGGKLHFWEPRSNTSDAFLSPGCVILLAVRREMGGWAWQSEDGTKTRGSCHAVLTSHLVHQNAWGNNASVLREELLQFLLSHSFWQATDV